MLKNLLSALLLVVIVTPVSAQSEEKFEVKQLLAVPADSLKRFSNRTEVFSDTLNPQLSIKTTGMDSIKQSLNHRIDSLNDLQLPTNQYTRVLDSLNQLGEASFLQPIESRMADAQTKAVDLEKKLASPVDKLEQTFNDKLNLMKKEGGESANLPSDLEITGSENMDLDLPDLDLNQPQITGVPENEEIVDLPNLSSDVPSLNDLNDLSQDLSEVKDITSDVAGYGSDIKSLTSGNFEEVNQIPERLEAEAIKNMDVEELQEHTKLLDQHKELLASGNDPEALKKQALQKAPKLAANHFKGKEELLQQAIDKVNSYKNKYAELTDLENIPKHQPNEMKYKPLVERLVPGITMQIQNSTDFWLDYNASIGYRVTRRFNIGLGWNERIGITNKISFTTKDRVYGPRSFLEYKFRRGFAFRSDIEKMNVFVKPADLGPSDFGGRQWKWGVFVGMKKEYDFIKSVKGNFQFLYNIYDDHGLSPYLSRFMVRFGFEFPIKRSNITHK